jgi:hypothetical protein
MSKDEFEQLPIEEKYQLLKQAATNVIHQSLTTGRGSWQSEFGAVTMNTMLLATGFNLKDRNILKESKP